MDNDTIVLQAKRSYWREFINSSTTNPNIKSGLQDALTFYGDTGFFDLNIQDIAFNHNQLVQAVVGESQAIIKEGEFRGKIEAQQFTKMLSDLKAEAAKMVNLLIGIKLLMKMVVLFSQIIKNGLK